LFHHKIDTTLETTTRCDNERSVGNRVRKSNEGMDDSGEALIKKSAKIRESESAASKRIIMAKHQS